MPATDMRVSPARTVVAQVAGRKMGPYGPANDPPAPNDTLRFDFFDGDIGVTWDMLDGRYAVAFGDCGGAEFGGYFGGNTKLKATRKINNAFIAKAAADFAVGEIFEGGNFALNSAGPDVPSAGIVHIQTGVGPGGWASFLYTGKFTTPQPGIQGVVLLCGGGTISPGQDVWLGEPSSTGSLNNPRTNGGYRGNQIAAGSTEDLGSGVILDTLLHHADGCSIEALPFAINPAVRNDVFPTLAGSPGKVLGITRIRRENGWMTIDLDDTHGLPDDHPFPTGPACYIENVPFWSSSITAGTAAFHTGSPDFLAGTATIPASTIGAVGGIAIAVARRISVQTLAGWTIVEYESIDGTHFNNCKYIRGPQGYAGGGGQIVQGTDRDAYGNLINAREHFIWDAPTSTQVRMAQGYVPDRDGGLVPGAKLHLPNVTAVANPLAAKHAGLFPLSGFSVPNDDGLDDVMHCMFALNSHYNGAMNMSTACELWYSLDGGVTAPWQRAADAVWPQEIRQNARIRGMVSWYDADDNAGWGDSYVLGIANPALILWRCLPDGVLDRANYEYWTGGDPTNPANWSDDEADGQHLGWTNWSGAQAGPVTSMSLAWLEQYGCWMVTYFPGGEQQDLTMWARFSDDLLTWTPAQKITSGADFPLAAPAVVNGKTVTNNGYIYGGFIHPWSGACRPDLGNDPESVVLLCTLISPYQVYEIKVPLYDLSGETALPKTVHGKQIAGGASAVLEGFRIQKNDGWIYDDHTWTRVDADTITTPADLTAFIQKYDPFSCHDGTATRYAYVASVTYNDGGNGLTTVNLIPHNDGSASGSILANGAITAVRYSKASRPQGFPPSFAYTATIVGLTSLSINVTKYSIVNGRVRVYFYVSGTSNGTTHSITGPVANTALDTYGPTGYSLDNTSTNGSTFPFIAGSASVITFFKTSPSIGTWTGSGTSSHRGVMEYEAA